MTKEPPKDGNVTSFREQMLRARIHGRPVGAEYQGGLNRPFTVTEQEIQQDLAAQGITTTPNPGLTPYGYLMQILRDPDADPDHRLDAAIALLPYCHKKDQP